MSKPLHHFVPRFYLRQFIDESRLPSQLVWVYVRGLGPAELRPLNRVAAEKGYYTVEYPDGTKSEEVEEQLSRIESQAAIVLRQLNAGRRALSLEERVTFSTFVALMFTRGPKFRSDAERVGEAVGRKYTRDLALDPVSFGRKFEEMLGCPYEHTEALRQAILSGDYKAKAWGGTIVQMMAIGAQNLDKRLLAMQWSFREADPAVPLVTSDSPVVLNTPSTVRGRTPAVPDTLEVWFPVSPRLLFIATYNGHARDGKMSPFTCRQINKGLALWAHKYVYAPVAVPAFAKHLTEPCTALLLPRAVESFLCSLGE